MITLTKSGNAIVFTFDDNDHYLNDGTIEVPVNSLTLVTDESQMATFKKSASNDVFISARYDELGMSKSDLESWFKTNACSTGGGGGGGVTSGWVENYVEDALVPYAESSAVTEEISEAVSGKADTSDVHNIASNVATVSGDVNTLSGSVNTLTGNVNALSGDVANKADTTAVTASINAAVSGKADASDVYTKTEVNDALDDKQDTLSAGTGISIVDNVISAEGGGGKAVSGGTNISITTGETADTVSCTLPISADTNSISINRKNIRIGDNNVTTSNLNRVQAAIGDNVRADGIYSLAFGSSANATNYCTVSMGFRTESTNQYQVSFGRYNNSVSGSSTFGDSGNTLFSVGNGTDVNARHNAFEIRQNGDIYITKDGADVLLQDELGGGGIAPEDVQDMIDASLSDYTDTTVQSMIDSSLGDYYDADTIDTQLSAITKTTDRIERVTATALNDLNAKLGGMKLVQLTQAQYDALTVKDPQTLFIITNVVN